MCVCISHHSSSEQDLDLDELEQVGRGMCRVCTPFLEWLDLGVSIAMHSYCDFIFYKKEKRREREGSKERVLAIGPSTVGGDACISALQSIRSGRGPLSLSLRHPSRSVAALWERALIMMIMMMMIIIITIIIIIMLIIDPMDQPSIHTHPGEARAATEHTQHWRLGLWMNAIASRGCWHLNDGQPFLHSLLPSLLAGWIHFRCCLWCQGVGARSASSSL